MGRGWATGLAILVLAALYPGAGFSAGDGEPRETILFAAADPSGDDRGAGSLRYPTHDAFQPFQGLFDLLAFTVVRSGDRILFDLTFGAVTNPFSAPEGFYHQRVDVYIHTGPGEGRQDPFRPGPHVRFHPRYPWHWRLRVAPFGGTRLHSYRDPEDSPGWGRGLEVGVRPDGRTIRVSVPAEGMGIPGPRWRYYVLVGGYDHFGPDEWRDVTPNPGPWTFGGGGSGASDGAPRVVDLLAPRWSWPGQGRQLGRPDPGTGAPVVYPVGGSRRGLLAAALGLMAVGLIAARIIPRLLGRAPRR